MQEYLRILRRSALFDGIDEAEILSLLGCLGARKESFHKNDYLLHAGETPNGVGLVLAGSVLVVQEDFWGERSLRARRCAGQAFAEAFACLPNVVSDVSVAAAEDGALLWLNVRRILKTCPTACAHHSLMIRNLVGELAASDLRLNEMVTHLSRRSTREKLLSYFSAEARRQGKTQFTLPFDRQQLADYLSVERSAMSAELSKMQREGLLTRDRSVITLHKKIRESI